ncbi:MAG: hypothetical protein V3U35_07375 [Candidatus Neomarinimicrobiota bacterium]
MSTGLESHRPSLREEAFDLFVAGYSRRRLCAELRGCYGSAAPSESAVGNWSRRDCWVERRVRIRQLLRARADTLRALAGPDLTAQLHKLRRLVVEAVGEATFRSAEGALYSLAALERVIARHEDREAERTLQEHRRSLGSLLTFLEAGEPAEPQDRPADQLPEVTPLGQPPA